MIPTIDISSVALIAALLKALHWIISGARIAGSWFFRVVIGAFIATKYGRSILEFGLFAFIYTLLSRAAGWFAGRALGSLVQIILPPSLIQGFDVLNCVLPANELIQLFAEALVLVVTIKNYQFAYRAYHRVSNWLWLLMHTGRV